MARLRFGAPLAEGVLVVRCTIGFNPSMRVIVVMAVASVLILGACSSADEESNDARSSSVSDSAPSNPTLPPPVASPAEDPVQSTINAALSGLSEAEAEAAAAAAGYDVRVVSVDGEQRMTTMDYRTDRINLEIEDGQVTRAFVG